MAVGQFGRQALTIAGPMTWKGSR